MDEGTRRRYGPIAAAVVLLIAGAVVVFGGGGDDDGDDADTAGDGVAPTRRS